MMRIPTVLVALIGLSLTLPAQHSHGSKFGQFLRGAASVLAPVPPMPFAPRPAGHMHGHQRGHWQTIQEQVLVPGYWQEQHVPPTYGWIVQPCGRRVWGIVDQGGCRRVWVPARWETRTRQVWVVC